ncbi:hypothetical protein PHISP_01522 [Aspergillus sp. HF37]|nr:hypothetical protein PHISP_01522 [Aspergillus sp. HF37]
MAADHSSQFQIKRKPVSGPSRTPSPPPPYPGGQDEDQKPPLPPKGASSTAPDASESGPGAAPDETGPQEDSTDAGSSQKPEAPAKAAFQKAYGETRHFLGGLITHPTVSNKHFTILRHSHGVVYYRGSTTSVVISIFSDAPLPADRTLWLQSRGFSGKTGMKAKAFLHLHSDWLNVTPAMAVGVDQVDPPDERAWQRDIGKFRKRAKGRVRDTHHLRETAIVRIPVEAGDGYFSVILCRGEKKKSLCSSPVFRVLSTSMDPSSIRGASISTLPLELGAMAMSLYAQAMAEGAIEPVVSKVARSQPSWLTQTAAESALEAGKKGGRAAGSLENADGERPYYEHGDSFSVENGPSEPYPMDFKARGMIPTEGISAEDEDPKFALKNVPDWVVERFDGYYFGWARYEQKEEKKTTMGPWQPVILNVKHFDPAESARVNMSQAMKRIAFLRFVGEVQLPSQSKVEARIMGFLRPPPPAMTTNQNPEARQTAAEAAYIADACDASFTQSVLDHPAWAPDVPSAKELQRTNTGKKERTKTGLSNTAAGGKKFAEKVPLHWVGVRSPMAEMKDKRVTVNGFYIAR